ncbi:hypothetical protein P152DRAFT_460684 [Eremomyces bilateralis CBS 781.70]|uniref:Delta(24)-sterol reductase n=1 Tax=Eremomyces bilateralis CBS 781.70 TaxID=1392243 RepID=A0A6G1FWM0_9PEZI|nr:uncharacterized protein P152DRAFT_460684 [Eremomyces bilateralis CBS 781.70]KAF1810183.1 hypothetical protein P152DRAFT_460684 [Eremomyces bilateralis CBS 781.70]
MKPHDLAVKEIASRVRSLYSKGEPFRIYHGSTNSTRKPSLKENHVDMSRLNHVLKVDRNTRTALVEPNVPMDRLVQTTLQYGLVPPVVMEFPGITAGGGYAGTSGESSSFRHGFFDRTLNWVEMVLADGEVVKVSESERKDLFRGGAGAVGSLGVVTLVELNLLEAKEYVEVTYHRTNSSKEAIELTYELSKDPAANDLDYVDGILYNHSHGVVVTGKMVSKPLPSMPLVEFVRPNDPWYYLHAKEMTSDPTSQPYKFATTLPSYLFRYNRGTFWVARSMFRYFFFVPFNRLMRWFLDDFLRPRMAYRSLHASGQGKHIIVQDCAVPFNHAHQGKQGSPTAVAEEFLEWMNGSEKTNNIGAMNIWPLWLCPVKVDTFTAGSERGSFHPHLLRPQGATDATNDKGVMLNVGVWGIPHEETTGWRKDLDFRKLNRTLEDKVHELQGQKWLYAHTHYEKGEFADMYRSTEWYDALREKYSATSLPTVYDKVSRNNRSDTGGAYRRFKDLILETWPLGGIYGIWKGIWSFDWRLERAQSWMWKSNWREIVRQNGQKGLKEE